MAAGDHLGPDEEHWREVFDRLCERFPTVTGRKVADVLRENDFHAGSSAKALRDLVGHGVRDADPDDAEHVRTLLSNPMIFNRVCQEHFRKFDVNGDGVLELSEILELTSALYKGFGLPVPSQGSVQAFIYAMDENHDGVLDEKEFQRFFEVFLRYAFFDVMKLRDIVKRGLACQSAPQQEAPSSRLAEPSHVITMTSPGGRTKQVGNSRPNSSPRTEASEETADNCRVEDWHLPGVSPSNHRRKCSRSGSRTVSPRRDVSVHFDTGDSHRKPAFGQSARKKASLLRPEDDRPPGRSSNRALGSQSPDRRRTREGVQPAFRCVAPGGVALRELPEGGPPREDDEEGELQVPPGAVVQALEVWIRTKDGWLPVMDKGGDALFLRRSNRQRQLPPEPIEEHSREPRADRQHGYRRKVSFNEREGGTPTAPETWAVSLQPHEEDWRPAFERLCERFPSASTACVLQAMRDCEGHAGMASAALRDM